MEDLLEFLFGASGRINRAKYWRSFLIYLVAGAVGRRDPVHRRWYRRADLHHHGRPRPHPVAALGFSITTERLHDRDKSAWWLLVFYGLPAALGELAKAAWFAEPAGTVLHSILALAGFALSIWGFVEIGCLGGTVGSNTYGPDPLSRAKRPG